MATRAGHAPQLLLLHFLLIPSLALPPPVSADPRLSFSQGPRGFAERLIRGLNLLPEGTAAGDDGGVEGDAPRLVEKKLSIDILGDSGANNSAEALGHHAGFFRLEHSHAARMFYFFFESRGANTDPLVIWLTGGPGCASELALFYENGPFKIADNMSLIWNEFGWDKASNIIFVDQPTGTGFSYSTDIRDFRYNEDGVSNDLYDFLQAFLEAHPDYLANDFYITGESYAGHYIPAFAGRVYSGNKEGHGLHINLKGFAIGNGLTDPSIQYRAYTDYALEMGLVTQSSYDKINKIYVACDLGIKLCGSSSLACIAAFAACNSIFNSILLLNGGVNYYDIRKKCEGNLCYDFSNMEKYLNQNSVRDALGVGDRKFVSCSTVVYAAMITDWMKNLEVGIPALIEDGIRVLIYAGEYDLICNWLGNSRWVESMEWSGQQMFSKAPKVPFTVAGEEAGILKAYGPLTFLKVYDAGHMVPMDQPKAALEMLKRWMDGSLAEADSVSLVTDMK